MTEKKILIKRKLCDVIGEATQLKVLNDQERKLHTEKLEQLLSTIDAELDVIEAAVKKRLVQKADEEENKILQKILAMTAKDFPSLLTKVKELKFIFECSGVLWTEDFTEYCYSRDHNGHCDDSNHTESYRDKLCIEKSATKEFVYEHTIDCGVYVMDHSDEKVHVRVDLRKSMDFMIDYRFETIAKTETEFLKWVCEVHKLFYADRAELSNGDGHAYTDELKHIMFGKLIESLVPS